MLKGKCVVVGVCGGIAAYKSCMLVSSLSKLNADVRVIMTEAAKEFVGELTFRTLSKNPVYDNMFNSPERWEVEHVELAKKADALVICPASANTIAKLAYGMADNALTATVLASKAKKIICPAMNTGMYENEATQSNMDTLKKRGFLFVDPDAGLLACGDCGKGRLAEPEDILEVILNEIACEKDLAGKNVLVSAGPTCEAIDPVRYITNHSSGKMGYAVAKAAALRGARVVLVSGKTAIKPFYGVNLINVTSAEEMYNEMMHFAENADIIIKSAAVADFAPKTTADNKLKKSDIGDMSIKLKKTRDILAELGAKKNVKQVIGGFCMETKDLLQNAEKKLKDKNCDFIVANNLFDFAAGFGTDTNTITILGADGKKITPENMEKEKLAHIILDVAKQYLEEK